MRLLHFMLFSILHNPPPTNAHSPIPTPTHRQTAPSVPPAAPSMQSGPAQRQRRFGACGGRPAAAPWSEGFAAARTIIIKIEWRIIEGLATVSHVTTSYKTVAAATSQTSSYKAVGGRDKILSWNGATSRIFRPEEACFQSLRHKAVDTVCGIVTLAVGGVKGDAWRH